MSTTKTWRVVALAHVLAGVIGLVAVACSDDDDAGPGTTDKTDSGPKVDGAVKADAEAGSVNPDGGGGGKPPGCFSGTPTSSLEFLNACTTADFVVFDNCARLNLCDGAALPPRVDPPKDAGVDAPVDTGTDTGAADAPADG
jgi:hypothetical protein